MTLEIKNIESIPSGLEDNTDDLKSGESLHPEVSLFKKTYTIDELARAADSTVRNIRAYQDKGILPPPFKKGRVGLYTTAHLTRLKLITDLLERGFSMSNIKEMINAWQKGQDIGLLFGLEQILSEPWSEELEEIITLDQLIQLFGETMDPAEMSEALNVAVSINILSVSNNTLKIKKPEMFKAGVILFNAGVPIMDILKMAQYMEEYVDNIAKKMVSTVTKHIIPEDETAIPTEIVPKVATLIQEIRPLAKSIVDSELSRAIEHQIRGQIDEQILKFTQLGIS